MVSDARAVILVVDDEAPIRRAIVHALVDERVLEAATAQDGIDLAAAERPDLIVLDLGLPDRDGEAMCRDLRGFTTAPILVLSARHADAEKVSLLDAGADDYVTKPFSPTELKARVRALLRRAATARSGGADGAVREHGALTIDFASRSVRVAGHPVHLTPIEWGLLVALASAPGKVFTHRQLFQQVWKGRERGDAQQYLRVYVANLRRKLENDPVRPQHIFTIPGVGYRFGS
jgi:two-component system KDP operon response regulator KdpE